ncbi:hypothetical protein [Schumannella soli]|uniref:DUF916 domain-containing protein n=1 Tax=Schumannella soli TaxID=2590779 RepID=A0A506XWK8_9MICO|nr:hypothetical protein [Schumannella soli]TPW77141.1 hypothetical protein FJ657_00035 [Schumannella soli]
MKRMLAAALLAGAAVVLTAAAPVSAFAADDLEGGGDYPISVTVTGDGSVPSGGSDSGGFGGSGSGSSGFGSSGSSGGSAPSDTVDTGAKPSGEGATAVADAAFSLGGLRLGYLISPIPTQGELSTSVTLRNGTDAPMPVTIRAWLTGPLGNRIGGPVERTVTLAPQTDRTLRMRVGGVGQWTFITSHLEATPPKSVDGVALKKLTREQSIVIAPWAILLIVIVGAGAGYGISVAVRRPRRVVQESFA